MPAPPADALRRIERAYRELASATDPSATAAVAVRHLSAAAGPGSAVRISAPDRFGRLRTLASLGDPLRAGRLRSSRRREAYQGGRAVSLALADHPGWTLLIRPLGGEAAVGVVEVVAPDAGLDGRLPELESLMEAVAWAIRAARERTAAERTIRGLDAALGLAAKLLDATDAATALRAATGTVHRQLRGPVIGCVPTADVTPATRGLPPAHRAEALEVLEGLTAAPGAAWTLATRLGPVFGGGVPMLIAAGPAILVVDGQAASADRDFLTAVGRLLAAAFRRIDDVALARLRSESLDLGIAWTAHELRGPLLGARAALEHVASGGSDPRSELLRRTGEELGELVDVVDPLLRWSAGSGTLRRRRVEVSRLVREAVASSATEDPSRIRVEGPEDVRLQADPVQLRVAIANLVRNALAYSGTHSPVSVRVAQHGGSVSITVHDDGPGVPAEERELVFDPFARGRAASRVRGGKGLGLFIARRVVEAHGGTLRLLPSARGAEFCVELPATATRERSERSAS